MKKYYWLGSYPLASGSIVEPGNWGRIINLYNIQNAQSAFVAAKEFIFENIRVETYPERPSRLSCLFLCEDLASAKDFQEKNGRINDIIYEVEIVGKDEVFRTDWSILNKCNENPKVSNIKELAEKYWKGVEIENPEALTNSSIKIIKKIQ